MEKSKNSKNTLAVVKRSSRVPKTSTPHAPKLIFFSKRDMQTRPLTQDFLEAWLACQREFQEFEETLAWGIHHGFTVEPGARTIEFVPVRDEDGGTHLQLVVR